MKNIAFIVNPISGTKAKNRVGKLIRELLDLQQFSPTVVVTEYAGHATQLAQHFALEGYYAVVAVGGDGTVNEVASGLIGSNTALGILPNGSGNGFARHLDISTRMNRAIEMLNSSEVINVDYGMVNNQPFFSTCGVGFDAFVSLKFADSGKRGLLTYLENTLHESLTYQPETYEIENEEGTMKFKAFLIACGNASQYGNNAYIAPHASLTDGLMDVTILEPFTVWMYQVFRFSCSIKQ